jgi:hypothetical protein
MKIMILLFDATITQRFDFFNRLRAQGLGFQVLSIVL